MKVVGLFLWAFASLFAQDPGSRFEVVAVKPSPPNNGSFTRGCKGGPGTGDP